VSAFSVFWKDAATARTGARYLAVGAFCMVFNNVLLIAFSALGLPAFVAAAAVVPPSLALGYLLQAQFVFHRSPERAAFIRYCAALLSNQPIWILGMALMSDICRVPVVIAGPVLTVALFFWNYFATRWALGTAGDAVHDATSAVETRSASRPLRIAIVCDAVAPWRKGGRETVWREFARRLVRPGQEVHVYTMHWWDGPRDIELDGVHYHAVCKRRDLYKGERRSTAPAIWFSLGVFKLLGESFDALHVDQMPFFPLYSARIVAWIKRMPMTATWYEVWGRDYWLGYMGGLGGLVGYLVEWGAMRLPDAIASDSMHTSRRLRAAGARCVHDVPLGVPLAAVDEAPRAEIESDVIYVGRLIEHKGVDMLLRAFRSLLDGRPELRLVIVGVGPEEKRLAALVRELGLETSVSMLGEVPDDARVYGLMKASKVLALPSRREGFGLVVLEANAAGLPVVTLDHPDNAARDLVQPGVSGFLAQPDAEDLARTLAVALDRRETTSPQSVAALYDWGPATDRLDGLLRSRVE
jgi:glycosyltransferase involved in cell wall biosynthesis/putative flippase GtrA